MPRAMTRPSRAVPVVGDRIEVDGGGDRDCVFALDGRDGVGGGPRARRIRLLVGHGEEQEVAGPRLAA